MQFPHTLFKDAGLAAADVAALFGVSRVTGHRWLKGSDRNGNDSVGVNVFLRDRVAKLVPSVEHAVRAGALPAPHLAALPPAKRVKEVRSILKMYRPAK